MSALEQRYAAIVAESGGTPWEHVDALLGALLARHPGVCVSDAASWLTKPEFQANREESTRVDSDRCAIIGSSGSEATGIAPGPARNEGGSDR